MIKPKLWLCLCTLVVLSTATVCYYFKDQESFEEREEEEGELEETGADKSLAMWFQARAYPDPYYLNDKYADAWKQALAMKPFEGYNDAARVTAGAWTPIGPDETIGGRILSIAINPKKSSSLFIGTASGGLWRSYFGGTGSKNWKPVSTNVNTLGISSVIINPVDTNILYAGTGEVYRIDPANTNTGNIGFSVWKARGTYGVGILKSIDGGDNWTQVYAKTTPDMFAIQMLKFDPVNPDIIYACATDGLYKSTDAGVNWNRMISKVYVTDVAINPSNTSQVVIAVGNLVNSDKGIYRSADGGATWSAKITSALPAAFKGYIRFDYVNGSKLYASIGGPTATTDELYLSTNFGTTWIKKTGTSHCGGQYWFGHDLAVDPADDDHIIMGGVTYTSYLSTSTTNGNGSGSATATNVHADVHDIKYDPTNSNTVYIACDGGMWKSTDAGANWSNINSGLGATQFYASIATSPTTANIFIGGLQDNGVVKYDGTGWTSLIGGDGGPCAFASGTKVLYSNDARAVYISTNTGSTESQKLKNMGYGIDADGNGVAEAYDDRTAFMSPVAISKSNPSIMYVGSDNLHVSIDGGTSFSGALPANMTRPIELTNKTAVTLAVSPTNPDKVYVSTSPFSQRADDALNVNGQPNILRSINASAKNASSVYIYSFTSIKGTLPDRFIMDMAISKFNDDSVYAVLGGFGTSHIYVTPNAGGTWTDIGTGKGLPDVPFNAVLIDPVNPKTIYVGTDYGVYVSPDRGGVWYPYNTGFWDATLVMDLQTSFDNKLVAATHGKGVFVGPLFSGVMPVEIIAFNGVRENEVNKLSWKAESESKLKQYEVERSIDGITFSKIGVVQATNSAGTITYNFTDAATSNSSKFYYRLKCVNTDGSYTYSVVLVLQTTTSKPLMVLQNPFTDKITVSLAITIPQPVVFTLSNNKGQIIRRVKVAVIAGTNTYSIKDLQSLPRGIYILDAIIGQERKTKKLLKE